MATAIEVNPKDLAVALAAVKPAYYAPTGIRLVSDGGGDLCVSASDVQRWSLGFNVSALCPLVSAGDPFDVCVPHGVLTKVMSAYKDRTLRLSVVEGKDNMSHLVIGWDWDGDGGDGEVRLNARSSDEFPSGPVVDRLLEPWKAGSSVVRSMRAATICATDDEARPVLTGVYLDAERGNVAATNSYILGIFPHPQEDLPPESMLIPRRMIDAIPARTDEILVSYGRGRKRVIELACDSGVTITGFTIDGEFPNYAGLIPSSSAPIKFAVGRNNLTKAAKFAKGMAGNGRQPMRVTWLPDERRVVTGVVEQDLFTTEYVVEALSGGGVELRSALNPEYVVDTMNIMGLVSEDVLVEVRAIDNLKPWVFTADDTDAMVLLMPVRIA